MVLKSGPKSKKLPNLVTLPTKVQTYEISPSIPGNCRNIFLGEKPVRGKFFSWIGFGQSSAEKMWVERKKISKQQLIPNFDFQFECQMTFCFNLPIWRTKFFLTWAKICTGWISTVVFFFKCGPNPASFCLFSSFFNTMINLV